ncbi:MAG: hypothetical protein MUD12_00670 [Spirochaetes bacterium]|jgi:hypothetical protein|nr:hypothetical protein [Spirochaetota bacterium]
MELKKINKTALKKIFDDVEIESDSVIGSYLYRGFRIQISRYNSPVNERYMRLYKKRRELGICIRCGKKVTNKNSRTGKLYRLCEFHRSMTDKKK